MSTEFFAYLRFMQSAYYNDDKSTLLSAQVVNFIPHDTSQKLHSVGPT